MTIAMAYEIEDMVRVCEERICHTLTNESACDMLVIADALPTSTLAERVMAYIVANAKKVFLAKSFRKLLVSNSELAIQITQRVSQMLP